MKIIAKIHTDFTDKYGKCYNRNLQSPCQIICSNDMQNNHSRIDSSHSYRKPLCSYKDAENHNAYNQRNLIE